MRAGTRMEVAWCGRRGRETEQQCGRSHERQVRDAGGGAPGSWRKKEAMCLCLHDVSGDPSTSHFVVCWWWQKADCRGLGRKWEGNNRGRKHNTLFTSLEGKIRTSWGFECEQCGKIQNCFQGNEKDFSTHKRPNGQ